MKLVQSHPCIALWYIFIEDFWDQNKDMETVKELDHVFNPKNATSLAYRPKNRTDFEKIVEEVGLRDEKKFFSNKLLDCLYESMDKFNQAAIEKAKHVGDV